MIFMKKAGKKNLAALFSGNLNALRTKKGVSMKRAASDLGVARSTWCQWENGKRFPSAFFLELLAEYFDIPACRLVAAQEGGCFLRAADKNACAKRRASVHRT